MRKHNTTNSNSKTNKHTRTSSQVITHLKKSSIDNKDQISLNFNESSQPIDTNVKVVCRFRPMNEKEKQMTAIQSTLHSDEFNGLCVKFINEEEAEIKSTLENNRYLFTFDKIFNTNAHQEDIFKNSAYQIVDSVLQGFNGTILAYGQTGSGKTFTMSGLYDDMNNMGIIPRSINQIFNHILSSPEEIEYTVKISILEIYMEKVRDLIDPSKYNLNIREDKLGKVYIDELSEHYIASPEEIMEFMKIGNINRTIASTNMNEESSRSHSITIITVNQNNTKEPSAKSGKLFLVDLAGSEKISKTGVTGLNLDEAKNINKSLTTLGMVINSLTDGKSTHIPYRESKLTRILSESLGGNSKTSLIITCSPATYNESESLSTMRFGMRAKKIKNKPKINKELTVSELKLIIQKLENQLTVANIKVKNLQKFIDNQGLEIPIDYLDSEIKLNHKSSSFIDSSHKEQRQNSGLFEIGSITPSKSNLNDESLNDDLIIKDKDLVSKFKSINEKYDNLIIKYAQLEEDKNGLFDKLTSLMLKEDYNMNTIVEVNTNRSHNSKLNIYRNDSFSLNTIYSYGDSYQLVYYKPYSNELENCVVEEINYLDSETYYVIKQLNDNDVIILSEDEFKECCRIKVIDNNLNSTRSKNHQTRINNLTDFSSIKTNFIYDNSYFIIPNNVSKVENNENQVNFTFTDSNEKSICFQGAIIDQCSLAKKNKLKQDRYNCILKCQSNINFMIDKKQTKLTITSFSFEVYYARKSKILLTIRTEEFLIESNLKEKSLYNYGHLDSLGNEANQTIDNCFANNTVDIEQYYNTDNNINIYENIVTLNIDQLEVIENCNGEKYYVIKKENTADLLQQIPLESQGKINKITTSYNYLDISQCSLSVIDIKETTFESKQLETNKHSFEISKKILCIHSDNINKLVFKDKETYEIIFNSLNKILYPNDFIQIANESSFDFLKIKKIVTRVKDQSFTISSTPILIFNRSIANIDSFTLSFQRKLNSSEDESLIKEKMLIINEEKEKIKKEKKKFDQEKKLIIKSLEDKMEKISLLEKENKEIKEKIKILQSSLSLDDKQSASKIYNLEKSLEQVNILYHQAVTQKSVLKIENQVNENKIKKRDDKIVLYQKEIDELRDQIKVLDEKLLISKRAYGQRSLMSNINVVKVLKGQGGNNKSDNYYSTNNQISFLSPQFHIKEVEDTKEVINTDFNI